MPRLGASETRRAIEAASRALPAWKARSAKERARVLTRLATLMAEREEDLATLMVLEQGKPLAEARTEVAYALSFYEWFAEEAKRLDGSVIPSPAPDRRIVVHARARRSDGRHHALELPLRDGDEEVRARTRGGLHDGAEARRADTALGARDRRARRGGRRPAGRALDRHRRCRGRAPDRTGDDVQSARAQARLYRLDGGREVVDASLRGQIKKVSLELGGNAPFIVFDDADLEIAVNAALVCKFRNSGQTCVSANRMLVQAGIYDAFLERFTADVAALRVADGFAEGVQVGPLIDEPAIAKVECHVADALDHGAELVTGGDRLEGQFYRPSVLTGAGRYADEPGGDLRPGRRDQPLRDRGGGDRDRQRDAFGLAAYY